VRFGKKASARTPSELTVYLGRRCSAVTASIGQDDEIIQPGSVVFQVVGDDCALFDRGIVAGRVAARPVTVDTTGFRMLSLRVTALWRQLLADAAVSAVAVN
jgi:alpha-glucosidase